MKKNKNEPLIQKQIKRTYARKVMQDFKNNGRGLTIIERLGF